MPGSLAPEKVSDQSKPGSRVEIVCHIIKSRPQISRSVNFDSLSNILELHADVVNP